MAVNKFNFTFVSTAPLLTITTPVILGKIFSGIVELLVLTLLLVTACPFAFKVFLFNGHYNQFLQSKFIGILSVAL